MRPATGSPPGAAGGAGAVTGGGVVVRARWTRRSSPVLAGAGGVAVRGGSFRPSGARRSFGAVRRFGGGAFGGVFDGGVEEGPGFGDGWGAGEPAGRAGGVSRRQDGVTTGREVPEGAGGAENPSPAPVLTLSGRSASSARDRWTTVGIGAPTGSDRELPRAGATVAPGTAAEALPSRRFGAEASGVRGPGARCAAVPGRSAGPGPVGSVSALEGRTPAAEEVVGPAWAVRCTAAGAPAEGEVPDGPSGVRTGMATVSPGWDGPDAGLVPGPSGVTGSTARAGPVRRRTGRPAPSSGASPEEAGAGPAGGVVRAAAGGLEPVAEAAVGGSAANGAPMPPCCRDRSAGVRGDRGPAEVPEAVPSAPVRPLSAPGRPVSVPACPVRAAGGAGDEGPG
ncbi:hypothetical protein ACFYPK_20975 [Streptomyces halstedii]|uniref:hypothetical protein n=1 Tax=Streptomyces halstedii TaxID=1944 RepID=UPI0036B560F2